MNSQIKVVFLMEIKESLKENLFIQSTIINILIFAVIGFIIYYLLAYGNRSLAILSIILYPLISMLILSFLLIHQKFWNIKLVNGFQSLLTLPITLREIWIGKITAILVLSYPSTALIAIILSIAYFLSLRINPFIAIPLTLWIFVFIIGPLLIMAYNLINSWIILRFDNTKLIDILQFITLFIIIFSFIGTDKIKELVNNFHFTDWTMIIGGIFIIGMITSIIYHLINNLEKEKIIT